MFGRMRRGGCCHGPRKWIGAISGVWGFGKGGTQLALSLPVSTGLARWMFPTSGRAFFIIINVTVIVRVLGGVF